MRQNEGNSDIRERLAAAGLPIWRLAKAAGIASTTCTLWLREDLPKMDPRRVQLLAALQELEQQERTGQDGTAKDGNANDHGDS